MIANAGDLVLDGGFRRLARPMFGGSLVENCRGLGRPIVLSLPGVWRIVLRFDSRVGWLESIAAIDS